MNDSNNYYGNSGMPQQNTNPQMTPTPEQYTTNPQMSQPQMNNQVYNNVNQTYQEPVQQQPVYQQQPQPVYQQTPSYDTFVNDRELLQAYIGNNYEKITSKSFNFAGFFLSFLYLYYRKMFLYGLLLFLINIVVLNFVDTSIYFLASLGLNILVGFMVNKLYVNFALKKINKIRNNNPNKSAEELKAICASKGGTSVGMIFLGLLVEVLLSVVLVIVLLFAGIKSMFSSLVNTENWDIKIDENGEVKGTTIEDVSQAGFACYGDDCTITITTPDGKSEDYVLATSDSE